MLLKKTTDNIEKLAHLVIRNKGKGEHIDYLRGFKSGIIPEDISYDRSQGNSLTITGDECVQYHLCLGNLEKERELEYSSKNEIDKGLWHLVCEIFLQSDELKNPQALKKKLVDFRRHIIKPIEKYDVLIPIENLKMGTYTYEVAGVKFITLTPEYAYSWGLKKEKSIDKEFYDNAINKTVGLVSEEGADPWKAASRAKERLIIALNMVRIALLIDHDPRIIGWKIHDEQMLFKHGESTAVKKHGESEPVLPGWHRGFRSLDLEINENISKQLDKSREMIECLYSGNEIKGNLRDRIVRSMEWVSNSVTREKTDDKIIDLCTALETLLATKQDQKKGEYITLRMILLHTLLKKPYFSPAYVMSLYLKRSDIIHGSNINICSDSDYTVGRAITLEVLINTIEYIRKNNITQHSDFIRKLQSDKNLIQKSADFCKVFPEYYDDIAKAAAVLIL